MPRVLPAAAPMNTVTKICVVTRRVMLPMQAPTAMRMPISRSRLTGKASDIGRFSHF